MKGSTIVQFTAGRLPDTELWETQFPVMLKKRHRRGRAADAKFAYFDTIQVYPRDDRVMTEDPPSEPVGRKGRVRAAMASMDLQKLARSDIPVLIDRAPECFREDAWSITNTLVVDSIKRGKSPRVPVRDDTRRTSSERLTPAGHWWHWATRPTRSNRPGICHSTTSAWSIGSS